ncbi:MAG: protein kinase [Nitrospirae bacterium]|jgi:serine/threonine protein kinase|nr:protein kinase [Nitrospirota bacterium]
MDKEMIKNVVPSHTETFCFLIDIDEIEGQTTRIFQHHFCCRFLDSLPQEIAYEFIKKMSLKKFAKGDRIIHQGKKLENFYLILKGICGVNVERADIFYDIDKLGSGEIIGAEALFNEKVSTAHVHAETDVELLCMSGKQFEKLALEMPDLKSFMTSVLVHILSSSKLPDNRMIGKYSVTNEIGHGGAGIVFKGAHSVLNMPVAIKMLTHEMSMDPDFIELFRNEAKTIALMNHPNIVKVYDIEEAYKTIFIIMEYLEGATLDNVLENVEKLSLERIIDITIQVCNGLEYAHNLGIIHQDINPRNIFLQSDGRVKIIDFGLACRRGSVDSNFLFPGSLHYISPEQIQGNPVDERSDIYSLGITVYEMLTGEKPYKVTEGKDILKWHLEEDFDSANIYMENLPVELRNFFMKTIMKEPSERYARVSEILKELDPIAKRLKIERPCFCRQNQMMGMFLVFQEEQQLLLKKYIEEFSRKISETGASLKVMRFED